MTFKRSGWSLGQEQEGVMKNIFLSMLFNLFNIKSLPNYSIFHYYDFLCCASEKESNFEISLQVSCDGHLSVSLTF